MTGQELEYDRLYRKTVKASRWLKVNNPERIAILFCGWCGMGKSTISNRLAKQFQGLVFSHFDFGRQFGYDKSLFYPYLSFALDQLESDTSNRFIILDVGILGEKARENIFSILEARSYNIFFICIDVPYKQHKKRLMKRNRGNPRIYKLHLEKFDSGREHHAWAKENFEFDYVFDNSSGLEKPFKELTELINLRLSRVD